MSRAVAILEAAFALRDSGTASPDAAKALHELLPAALTDVPAEKQPPLSGEILSRLAGDAHAMAFVAAQIQGTGKVYKAYMPTIEAVPANATVFVCPVDGAYRWSRPDKAYPIPTCPNHPTYTLVPKQT